MADLFVCLFFFSSRRRHTRYIGDWSSDVCSSDLKPPSDFPPVFGRSQTVASNARPRVCQCIGTRCGKKAGRSERRFLNSNSSGRHQHDSSCVPRLAGIVRPPPVQAGLSFAPFFHLPLEYPSETVNSVPTPVPA